MKKTVTTMLSLALAMILVSSLSSGVILAKGDDDDDHKKKKYKTVKVIDLVFVDCATDPSGFTMNNLVTRFESSTDENLPMIVVGDLCIDANAAMLAHKFKLQHFGTGFDPFPGTLASRSIFERKRKVRVEKE